MSPYLAWQAIRYRKYIGSLRQRLGYLPISFNLDGDESIWIHAVSVGEVLTARALLPQLRERYPRLRLFLSTTTMTGQQVAKNNLQYVDEVFYLPVRPRVRGQSDASAGEAAALHHDGDRNLAEPAARVPPHRGQDDARQWPHFGTVVSTVSHRASVRAPGARSRRSVLHARRGIRSSDRRHRRRSREGGRDREPEVRFAGNPRSRPGSRPQSGSAVLSESAASGR